MDVDLRDFVSQMIEIARENLERDGFLTPAAFLVTPAETLAMAVEFNGPDEKEEAYRKVVETAREFGAMAIITLNDAHYRTGPAAADSENYYPGQLAAERAPECIFVSVSGPGIKPWCLRLPYRRTGDGLAFGSPEESSGAEIGLLPGWSSDSPPPS